MGKFSCEELEQPSAPTPRRCRRRGLGRVGGPFHRGLPLRRAHVCDDARPGDRARLGTYRELYTGYEWHAIDEESGRVFLSVQNRRDHPSGRGTIDLPGITILDYAGGGQRKQEQDFWSAKEREVAMKEYEAACRQFDPEHPKKHTRFDWGRASTSNIGIVCTIDQDTQNYNLLKLQPFTSFPSQVEVHLDGKFHCYAGCAMESTALSKMPPFAG